MSEKSDECEVEGRRRAWDENRVKYLRKNANVAPNGKENQDLFRRARDIECRHEERDVVLSLSGPAANRLRRATFNHHIVESYIFSRPTVAWSG